MDRSKNRSSYLNLYNRLYALTVSASSSARKNAEYKKNISNFRDNLNRIRLACVVRNKGSKVKYQLEKIPDDLKKIASILKISDNNIPPKVKLL